MRDMLSIDENDLELAVGMGGLKGDFKMVAPGGQVYEMKRVTLPFPDPDLESAVRLGLGALVAAGSLVASTLF